MYENLMAFHLLTVVPCVFLGAYLLLFKKGGLIHQNLGKLYMVLMLLTAFTTLFMEARVGPVFLGHFGWIHLFSFLVLWTVPTAYLAIRKGNVRKHQRKMILMYVGAILIAGGFTFAPGRYLHTLFF